MVIWLTTEPQRVPVHIQKTISAAERRFVSVVSYIEVALKHRKDPLSFPFTAGLLTQAVSELQALELPLQSRHGVRLERLLLRHRDPVDHPLIAQAIDEQLPLVSMDADIARYAEDGLTVIGRN
jgi:PIN domain nuclease of toxin-antitoxin system